MSFNNHLTTIFFVHSYLLHIILKDKLWQTPLFNEHRFITYSATLSLKNHEQKGIIDKLKKILKLYCTGLCTECVRFVENTKIYSKIFYLRIIW